jgi:hypothetical protein
MQTATERLAALQKRTDELGLRHLHISWNEDLKGRYDAGEVTLDDIRNDLCNVMESYLDGNFTVVELLDDEEEFWGEERWNEQNDSSSEA